MAEEEESEISLVCDIVTQDTEMSEPLTNQEDFFVWIKNLGSHMENREQFLRGLLNRSCYPNSSRLGNCFQRYSDHQHY
jgi:hypothetical protein